MPAVFFLRSGPRPLFSFLAVAAGWSFALAAAADEVKVLTADAFRPVVSAMAPAFEKRTGHKVVVVDGSTGALEKRIREGEEFDLAVLPPASLEALGSEGAVSDGSIIALARSAADRRDVYAGAVSASASNSQAALSLLILLASEETQGRLKGQGLAAP
jgi:ABC-type molybdate transport system substrate-binding protein